jgi:hypothetical protein
MVSLLLSRVRVGVGEFFELIIQIDLFLFSFFYTIECFRCLLKCGFCFVGWVLLVSVSYTTFHEYPQSHLVLDLPLHSYIDKAQVISMVLVIDHWFVFTVRLGQ